MGGKVICIDLQLQLEGLLLGCLLIGYQSIGLYLRLPLLAIHLLLAHLYFLRLNKLLKLHATLHLFASVPTLNIQNGGAVPLRRLRLIRHELCVWVWHVVLERITQCLVSIETGGELLMIIVEFVKSELTLRLLVNVCIYVVVLVGQDLVGLL